MNKNSFQTGMNAMGRFGNGLAASGGDAPAFTPAAPAPVAPGATNQPVSSSPGLGGIVRKFMMGNPAQRRQMGDPGQGTDVGSMVQRPGRMYSDL